MGYYYISKFQEQVPGTDGADGRIIMPSGVQAIALERRYIRPRAKGIQQSMFDQSAELEWEGAPDETLLLDPQLYLSGLMSDTCGDRCSYLVGYPWFDRNKLEA